MTVFQIFSLRPSTVWSLYRLKDRIQMDPIYQRDGEIWNLEKRQLLVDTILNQFDVPKIYLHKFSLAQKDGSQAFDYAVIDGKQRLNAIWAFIDGKFSLADDFRYLRSNDGADPISAAGLTYGGLAQKYPDIKTDFDSFLLDVVCIDTDDTETIEDLFSRLNEAVPLSAPEKRNALGGPLPAAVRTLSAHKFFTECLPFTNRRYRHYDVAAKILLIVSRSDIPDTKKIYIDEYFKRGSRNYSGSGARLTPLVVKKFSARAAEILDSMAGIFTQNDPLLRQVGMTILYFHLFRIATEKKCLHLLTRELLRDFEAIRQDNRTRAEEDISLADYDLLEFDRFTQSPNDAYAMRIRLGIFDEKMLSKTLGAEKVPRTTPQPA